MADDTGSLFLIEMLSVILYINCTMPNKPSFSKLSKAVDEGDECPLKMKKFKTLMAGSLEGDLIMDQCCDFDSVDYPRRS
mmetsp:Transcript_39410/g.60238  ORF Transcript_39410/g.60238 Transcript_39410/m.60238 type:complete len:80 (-) Transcript_39410:413-652(-)